MPLDRLASFRAMAETWKAQGRPGLPLLALDHNGPLGSCVSCGESRGTNAWRCDLCQAAALQVLKEVFQRG